ncbi:hypothetical protein GCM10010435_13500 [Winogradskya consettensis]|uniref:Uncharacterized protein n=1 Tax=Winogradskya consettensis TaxID=113560 RepID=A0A919SDZ2_9ACTN|nr:hypothetical protein Aco04nite_12770 [Actinoplanes consettensis]
MTVAVMLVVGQALLCGVIGFVTFGGKQEHLSAAPRTADAPVVVDPHPTGRPASAPPSSGTASRRLSRSRLPPAPPPVVTPTSRPSSSPPALTPFVATSPAPTSPAATTTPPDLALLPPEKDDAPVVRGICEIEGSTDRTKDGQAVRCTRGHDGRLRWRPVR